MKLVNLFKKNSTLCPKDNLLRIQEKISDTSAKFNERIVEIENFADSLYEKFESSNKKIKRFKRFCHSIDHLITDKDKNLKLLFANHSTCNFLYGLPNICSDLIMGRYEFDVINDYIEKTGNWNSFVECENFNIDELVLDSLEQKEFLQVGFVNDEKLILKTSLKPLIEDDKFDGIITVSNIIGEDEFNKMKVNSKTIYDKNDYIVYSL